MTTATMTPIKAKRAAPAARRRTLPMPAAFALLGSILIALLASSSAPTPLYAAYQAKWGFSDVTITIVFGVYAVAVLLSLLVFGSLSDHLGRRPLLAVALGLQAIVMVLFAFAGSLDALLVARVLQGLATGAALGAIGAGLVDLHARHGATANAASAMAGTGGGALASALFIQLLPDPTKLIYLALAVVFIVQLVGVRFIKETSARRPGALKALKPTLGVPAAARGALLITAPSLVAVWALAGFFASLGPSLASLISGSDSVLIGGIALFVLAGSGAVTVILLRDMPAQRLALLGNSLVIIGVAAILLALSAGSSVIFFAGAVIAGAGFGGGFQGSLRTIIPLASPTERAGLLSVAYLIAYLALGLPAIAAGVLVDHSSLAQTAREFGVFVIVLSSATVAGLLISVLRAERSRQLSEVVTSNCQPASQAA